eukprot:3635346-Rhodomonas_salina.2
MCRIVASLQQRSPKENMRLSITPWDLVCPLLWDLVSWVAFSKLFFLSTPMVWTRSERFRWRSE